MQNVCDRDLYDSSLLHGRTLKKGEMKRFPRKGLTSGDSGGVGWCVWGI